MDEILGDGRGFRAGQKVRLRCCVAKNSPGRELDREREFGGEESGISMVVEEVERNRKSKRRKKKRRKNREKER